MDKIAEKISVVVAIETRIYRDGITQLLERYNDTKFIIAVSNKAQILNACDKHKPDILLLDAMIPDALFIAREIKKQYAKTKLIVLAISNDRKQLASFSEEGALGFVTREDSLEDLHHCINASTDGGFWCSHRVAGLLLAKSPHVLSNIRVDDSDIGLISLTRQQVKVLRFIESGLSNKEIARKLNIETPTVKNHVHQILSKLSVNTRSEAAASFRRMSEPRTMVQP